MIGVKFGAFDMQANGFIVESTDVYSAPPNQIQADELAQRDGALIVQQRYTSKRFTAKGHIVKSSRLELEQSMDALQTAMSIKNQAFDIDHAGGIRRYLASAENVIFGERTGASSIGFDIQFFSPDGMGWDTTTSEFIAPQGVSLSSTSIPVSGGGSYLIEPTITFTLSAVSGGSAKTITISNGSTLRGLAVTRNWVASDVLEIDSLKRTVYVNDSAVEFSGQFPTWQPGANTFEYLDDFTSRSGTISANYIRRWL